MLRRRSGNGAGPGTESRQGGFVCFYWNTSGILPATIRPLPTARMGLRQGRRSKSAESVLLKNQHSSCYLEQHKVGGGGHGHSARQPKAEEARRACCVGSSSQGGEGIRTAADFLCAWILDPGNRFPLVGQGGEDLDKGAGAGDEGACTFALFRRVLGWPSRRPRSSRTSGRASAPPFWRPRPKRRPRKPGDSFRRTCDF